MGTTTSASTADHDHSAHEGHGEGGEAHATLSGYLTGFVLSVIMTAIPFWLVMARPIEDGVTTALLVVSFAVAQIFVHMIYFLHMDSKSEGGWTIMALIFTAVLVIITISGSLWVMYHLNRNMMPMGDMQMEHRSGEDAPGKAPVNELAPVNSDEAEEGPPEAPTPPPLSESGSGEAAPAASSGAGAQEGAPEAQPQNGSAADDREPDTGDTEPQVRREIETGSGETGRPHVIIIPRAGNGN